MPCAFLQGEEAGSPVDSKPEVFWYWTLVSVYVLFFGRSRSCARALCLLSTTCLMPVLFVCKRNVISFDFMVSRISLGIIRGKCMN